jgi:hypothetical protein
MNSHILLLAFAFAVGTLELLLAIPLLKGKIPPSTGGSAAGPEYKKQLRLKGTKWGKQFLISSICLLAITPILYLLKNKFSLPFLGSATLIILIIPHILVTKIK